MIPPLVLFALKILGCAIGIYVIAIFIASIKKLLPFLTIIASVATIFLVWYIQLLNKQNLIFVYTVMLIFINFLYMGESFFSYRVVKNTYMIVGVERRWKSLFSDFDDYIVHISPVEAGGFFSNVIGSGIIFSLVTFFVFPQYPTLGYILPVYYILMSLLDIVYLFWFEITGILRWFLHILIIIASAVSPVYVKEIMNKIIISNEEGVSYIVCKLYHDVDYNNSYYFEYSKINKENNLEIESNRFIYNQKLDASGYFKEIKNGEPMFYEVIYKDDRFKDYISFKNNFNGEYDFVYGGKVLETESVLKFKEIDETYSFNDYFKFNKKIFEASTYKIEENTLKIQYKNELEDHSYNTQFLYEIDENKMVTSFIGVECEIIDDDYKYTYIYQPRYEENQLKECFVEETKRIKGYITKASDIRSFLENKNSPVINENASLEDIELINKEMEKCLSNITYETNIFEDYDFVLDYIVDTDMPGYAKTDVLINDMDSQYSILYDDDMINGIKASIEKDFDKYKPQVFIYNELDYAYDLEYKETIDDLSEIIHDDIYNVFEEISPSILYQLKYYYSDSHLVAKYSAYKTTYEFYFVKENNELYLEKIEINRSKNNYIYHYVVYIENEFDIKRIEN